MEDTKKIQVWVHGMPARSLKQVLSYLEGDAHDQSKVEIFVNTGDTATSKFFPFPFTPHAEEN